MNRDERIRVIFARRRQFSRSRAARVLGRTEEWVEENRFSRENGPMLSWKEMVLLADTLWSTLQIYRALGPLAKSVFPRLRQRLVSVPILMTEAKAITLRYMAERDGHDIHEFISNVISVSRDEALVIAKKHPGYMEAWRFPYDPVADEEEEPQVATARKRRR